MTNNFFQTPFIRIYRRHKRLNSEAWLRRGMANGSEVTVRALVIILAGHELHHRKIIKEFI
jgi:hypothetical protein